MDVERARAFLLSLPHVVETQQWGDNLVFWVGDKAIGGKMFALIDLSGDGKGIVSFSAGPERFAELVERDGLFPAPYFARIHWVAAERWSALRNAEWEELLCAAQASTFAKLPPKVQSALALPPRELVTLVAEQRALRACKPKAAKAAPKKKAPRKAKPSL
jgi:predicted DNA-binding protein (MmcQ/YjbR family)